MFVQALCEDWTCERDWLWLATRMPRAHERRYCYQRVLQLNPHNVVARVELARLEPIPALLLRMSGSV